MKQFRLSEPRFTRFEFYHIFNKSIEGYGIFKDLDNARRFAQTLSYYNQNCISLSLSRYFQAHRDKNTHSIYLLKPVAGSILSFYGYCMMPDHYHLLVRINDSSKTSRYIGTVENSFTRYFNTRFDRKGPLWQNVFQSVRIESQEQLLHVQRYIHLNPTSSRLVNDPKDWMFSSYRDILDNPHLLHTLSHPGVHSLQKFQTFT